MKQDLDEFISGYLQCACWCGPSDEDLDGGPDPEPSDIEGDSLMAAHKDCKDFFEANLDDLTQSGQDSSQNGHDFWLTRNGHGAGYWDRGLGEIGDRLTAAAHVYGSSDMYLGDDELWYLT